MGIGILWIIRHKFVDGILLCDMRFTQKCPLADYTFRRSF